MEGVSPGLQLEGETTLARRNSSPVALMLRCSILRVNSLVNPASSRSYYSSFRRYSVGARSTSNDSVWGSAAGLLVAWEPFDFGRRWAIVNAATSGVQLANAELSLTRLHVAVAAANAFLTVEEWRRADFSDGEVAKSGHSTPPPPGPGRPLFGERGV